MALTNSSSYIALQAYVDPPQLETIFDSIDEFLSHLHLLIRPVVGVSSALLRINLVILDSLIQCFFYSLQGTITELV